MWVDGPAGIDIVKAIATTDPWPLGLAFDEIRKAGLYAPSAEETKRLLAKLTEDILPNRAATTWATDTVPITVGDWVDDPKDPLEMNALE